MKPINLDEIVSFPIYEKIRPRLRPLFIAEKDRRRFAVGPHLTMLFENDRTVWYQIQEMVRAEKMTEPGAIQHEVDTYNELMPSRGELSATLLIEFTDTAERDRRLKELVGLEQHLWMTVESRRVRARFDVRQMSEDQVSSVQFIRFPIGIDGAKLVQCARDGQLAVETGHPKMRERAAIPESLAIQLAEDLS
ncbi:MAG: DUF3501 family protein [Candidatus Binataceae bacterium]